MDIEKRAKRWRLILGKDSKDDFENLTGDKVILSKDEILMENALAAIYNNEDKFGAIYGERSIKISKWLGDIRKLFEKELVEVIQKDAFKLKGLKEMLFEKEVLENVEPNIDLLCTLLTLKNQVPDKSKDNVRKYIEKVVNNINQKMKNEVERAVISTLNRNRRTLRGRAVDIDFNYTIKRNLKNFSKEVNTIIPEKIYFYEKQNQTNKWNIILDIDQSGSMGNSIVYSSILGCILAKISSIKTRIIAFDTEVIDLSETYEDPVDMLFGIQMGGGTDIHKSLCYCEKFIENPKKTILFLISDLEEFGSYGALINKVKFLKESGVYVICLLAISDDGKPTYNKKLAKIFSNVGVAVFACNPVMLPELIEKVLQGDSLEYFCK